MFQSFKSRLPLRGFVIIIEFRCVLSAVFKKKHNKVLSKHKTFVTGMIFETKKLKRGKNVLEFVKIEKGERKVNAV